MAQTITIFLVYIWIYQDNLSLIIFTVGLKKKLSFCHSLAFVFNPIKHYNELQKIILEKKLTKDNEVSRSYRLRLNKIGELGISEVSHFHLSALYENAISINKKMREINMRLEVTERLVDQSPKVEEISEASEERSEVSEERSETSMERSEVKNEAKVLEDDSITTVSSEDSIHLNTEKQVVIYKKPTE